MIVITGATGALNGATVEHLLTRVPAGELAVSVRDTAKARSFADRGVEVRRGSYEDPAALRASFEGADQVLLVSSNDPAADAVALHRTAIEAAVAAGARRILYTSHQNVRPDSAFPRRGTTPPLRRSSPVAVSPGRRCATASTPTVSAGCSARGGRPAKSPRPRTARFRGPTARTPPRPPR
ncbi:NAD(P)H-binding protein [Amycolatopsis pretoriensis]|uniref:NAD(P)H-binding protein n=1 Tax=Amycolatopsis pretoriensis TaxID=218821 RepID=UPI000A9C36C2|nr:NAD(P)H-binding protein [Amycolatopsis pretoriensis]